jgi:hypothetical protein
MMSEPASDASETLEAKDIGGAAFGSDVVVFVTTSDVVDCGVRLSIPTSCLFKSPGLASAIEIQTVSILTRISILKIVGNSGTP